jgi:hypothetical protein
VCGLLASGLQDCIRWSHCWQMGERTAKADAVVWTNLRPKFNGSDPNGVRQRQLTIRMETYGVTERTTTSGMAESARLDEHGCSKFSIGSPWPPCGKDYSVDDHELFV